jgi:hypothetical protein
VRRIALALVAVLLCIALPAAAPAVAKKHCKKGYVLKTVKRHGKKVKVCKKRKAPAKLPGNTTPTNDGSGGDTTPGTGGDPGTGGPSFPHPSSQQSGDAAWQLIAPVFVNSHFTDCPGGGWGVSCSVEEVYRHCAGSGQTGNWEYHRYTPTSGSDINSYGGYQVTGAEANPDGSWAVEYVVDDYGNTPLYSWRVAADGTATGLYYFPTFQTDSDGPEQIGPMKWEQPAGC